jgi:integrase/recombinase XerD
LVCILITVNHVVKYLGRYTHRVAISDARVREFDADNMRIKVRSGKGGKDRFSLLGNKNLKALREYWKLYRPTDLLFPGLIKGNPLAQRNIQRAFVLMPN